MTLDESIAESLSRGDVDGAVATLAAVGFGAAQRWCGDANFTGAHLATNMRQLIEFARPALGQLTPEGIERERRYRAHCAAVVEARNLVRMGYDAGGWPVAAVGECMRRNGLTYAEFRAEAGIASADGPNWKPSERIEVVVRECTLADVRRVRALLLEHAPHETELLAACA